MKWIDVEEIKNNRKRIIQFLTAMGAIVLLYVFFSLIGVGCPIKFLTGISCCGCGMTRAYVALLHLDFKQAFFFHPLFALPPLFIILFLIKNKISIKIYRAILFTMCFAFVIVYLYRMISGGSDVVVFHPQEGVIFRAIQRIFF